MTYQFPDQPENDVDVKTFLLQTNIALDWKYQNDREKDIQWMQ